MGRGARGVGISKLGQVHEGRKQLAEAQQLYTEALKHDERHVQVPPAHGPHSPAARRASGGALGRAGGTMTRYGHEKHLGAAPL